MFNLKNKIENSSIKEYTDEQIIQMYVNEGVMREKIIVSDVPSVALYSLSRKCLVGEKGISDFELVLVENNSYKQDYSNNVFVSMQIRTELTINDIIAINNSEGIIVSKAIYDTKYFRYNFIPTKK